jgi:hypothetical protein
VIWRTFILCSVFCSLKVSLLAWGLWTRSFLPA